MHTKLLSSLVISAVCLVTQLHAGSLSELTNTESHTGQSDFFNPSAIEMLSQTRFDSELPSYASASAAITYQLPADFDGREGDLSVLSHTIVAPVKGGYNRRHHYLASLSYTGTKFDTSQPTPFMTEDYLQDVAMPLIYIYEYSEDIILGGMLMPGFSGDFDRSDNFYISATVGAGYAVTEDFKLFGGVYYKHGFGDDIIVPGIQFTWRPTERWELALLGPILQATYNINDSTFVSFTGRYHSPTWNVGADSNGPERDITLSSVRLGARIEHQLSERCWGSIGAGYLFARELEIEDSDDRTLFEEDIDSGLFVRAGLTLRF